MPMNLKRPVLYFSLTLTSIIVLLAYSSKGQERLLVPFRSGKFWGYSDIKKVIVIPPVYDSAGIFFPAMDSGSFAKVKKDGVVFLIDQQGQKVNESVKVAGSLRLDEKIRKALFKYKREIELYLYTYEHNGQIGIKYNNDTLTAPNYLAFAEYSNGIVTLKGKNGWALYDSTGMRLSNFYDSVQKINQQWIIVIKKGKYGVINRSGSVVMKPRFEYLEDISGKSLVAKKKGKFGLVGGKGEILAPFSYTQVEPLTYRYCRCYLFYKPNGDLVFIDNKGNRFEAP